MAARMPHRRGLGDLAADQRAETELGRMVLRGELEDVLATAGETYARLWQGYVATLGAPHSPTNGPGRGLGCNGCQTPEERKYCRCGFRKRIYLEAFRVLISTGGGVAQVVASVGIHDRPCPQGSLWILQLGLLALAEHFCLTTRRNRIYGNTSLKIWAPVQP